MNNIVYLKDIRGTTERQRMVEEAALSHIRAGREWMIQRFISLGDPGKTSDVYENVKDYPPMTREVAEKVLDQVDELYRYDEFKAHRIRPHEWIQWV
jgi:hypothetical protein